MKTRELYVPSESHIAVADGMRVLFLFVISWYHIWQQSWLAAYTKIGRFELNLEPVVRTGYMWVDGMLLLSGFLCFLPYARAMHDRIPMRGGVGNFYKKRVARILPAYLFFLLAVLLFDLLPNGAYGKPADMWRDILSHLTFTHIFFRYSYFNTPFSRLLWTLAVEVQFYLIFPLLAKAFMKRPAITWIGMVAVAWIYRGYVATHVTENDIWINQLIAFMDIYALGFLCAWMYVSLARSLKPSLALKILATALCAVICCALWQVILRQLHTSGSDASRAMQMRNRFSWGALWSMFLLCATWSANWLRGLLSCRPMRFLAGISYQYYLWHTYLLKKFKSKGIPHSDYESPNRDGDKVWQWQYTLLCFASALVVAILVTYLIERPAQRFILSRKKNKENSPAAE